MTAEIIQMKEPRSKRVRKALDEWRDATELWAEKTFALAFELKAARDECSENDTAFGHWLVDNNCDDTITKDERYALIKMAEHYDIAHQEMERTGNRSVEWLWRRHIKPRVDAATYLSTQIGVAETNLIPNPPSEPATEAKVENQEPSEAKVEAKSPIKKSESKLYRLGDDVADVLMAKFKNPRMLAHFLGGEDSQTKKRSRMLRYLATRIKADYPEEYLASKSWETRLLYPYLPQKMLERFAKHINMIDANHATLAATEDVFMKTPECGVTDPPMIAFNKAYSIYQSLSHAKNNGGAPIDRSAFVHKPTFAPDEGKHPVIVRGTQLWPRETRETYCYDDLRCAFGMAEDVLLTFFGPKDAPMTTKSLKLRHISAWLPPKGYNAVGATLEGVMRAWELVVYAYGVDKSEEMRKPNASLRKQGE